MLIIKPNIFNRYPEILCGVSTKIGMNRKAPYFFNLSFSVNDDPEIAKLNRSKFYSYFGLTEKDIAFQHQVHTDNISIPQYGGNCGDSDAMISAESGLGLVISTADCTPVFIYDPVNKAIAGIHSGWRSTEKEIISKTITRMTAEFNSKPENLIVYVGPSICRNCYEVGEEFADKFAAKYLIPSNGKYKLDLPQRNYDILTESGVIAKNIQRSELCTYEMKDLLHSYRRDGEMSGRALGLIVMKSSNE